MEGKLQHSNSLSAFAHDEISFHPNPTFKLANLEAMGTGTDIRYVFNLLDIDGKTRDVALSRAMSDKMGGMSAKPVQGDLVMLGSVVTKNGVSMIEDFSVVGKSGPSGGTPTFQSKENKAISPASSVMKDCLPFSTLTTFNKDFKIFGRVTTKTDLKEFNGKNGPGKVFSITILGQDGDQISGKFFNDAVDEHYETLKKGNCYTFYKGGVRLADKRFSSLDSEYELTFFKNSIISEIEDTGDVGSQSFKFTQIRNITSEFVNSYIDLCCAVKDQGEAVNFTSKAGNELTKKNVTVFDSSFATIEMTLWNEMAVRDSPLGTIMILKRMKITEFNGAMQLGFDRFSSEIMTGNTIVHNPEVQELTVWMKTPEG
jgi:hypothetical protein